MAPFALPTDGRLGHLLPRLYMPKESKSIKTAVFIES
jgi:hypothetical protein